MKTYNKLVRDLIPQIIKADNKECSVKIVSDEEKLILLEDKLKEEVDEYLKDKNIEELADIMEVICGLSESLGYSEEELFQIRDKKRQERGGFKEGILLGKVW